MGAHPPTDLAELAAAILQAVITVAIAALCWYLYDRYRKPYLGWWALAWGLYVLRAGAIISFLATGTWAWLYWHQVFTGWVALGLLWAALSFSRQTRWRRGYALLALFPPLWSYVAIFRLDVFLLAALPAVLFLSLATLLCGWVFLSYDRRVGSTGARLLGVAFVLWGFHHLDYPFLRARGAWTPWGYYLDVLFQLAVGGGIVLLVNDDLQRGLQALLALAGELQRQDDAHDALERLVERPLTLPAVRGCALLLGADAGAARVVRCAGDCAPLQGHAPEGRVREALARAFATGTTQVPSEDTNGIALAGRRFAYVALLPISRAGRPVGALMLVGDARDPFTALDDGFLAALGQQVGAALENAELYRHLQARNAELARLSARMVALHEEERRRLSRELHDETAQVFSAVKLELSMLRQSLPPDRAARLDRILGSIDTGIRSIRSVTNDLRPSLLDDLGLLPALRSLLAERAERTGLVATLDAPPELPPLAPEAELAIFRAVQEALSNVTRHAQARAVRVAIALDGELLRLVVEDDGRGPPAGTDPEQLERAGHMGLAGMRERIGALGGRVHLGAAAAGGARLEIDLPVPAAAPAGRDA